MDTPTRKLMAAYVRRVQKSASKYGGHCTWDFSQCLEPVSSIIGADKTTEDGVCEMLSAKWIDEHAHERALANWITTPGGKFDASKLRLIMQWFIIGETMRPSSMVDTRHMSAHPSSIVRGAQNQTTATQNFLVSKGLVPRWGRANGWGDGTNANEKIKFQLARELTDMRNGTGSYRAIGIWGLVGGHAMAAYNGLHDFAYFDPNFGEFWFEDKESFRKWWVDAFFPLSWYSKLLGRTYELRDYALKA